MNEHKYLITDEVGVVMAWSELDLQICYCNSNFPAKIYTKSQAQSHILTSKRNRKKWNMGETKYKLQRVEEA